MLPLKQGQGPSPETFTILQLPAMPHNILTLPRKTSYNQFLHSWNTLIGVRPSYQTLESERLWIDPTFNLAIVGRSSVLTPISWQTGDIRGETSASIETQSSDKPNIFKRFYGVCKAILFASWVNVLLVFVPVAIACEIAHVSPTIIFAMNAVAIIPLAGLLSYATESVAREMGDTVGALMNVTFGNAVELIIFMYVDYCIALVKNEIRIVQASILGSILANLLLILGMGFVVGGLRYREQCYELVAPGKDCQLVSVVSSIIVTIHQLTAQQTAFHASFTNNSAADAAVLKILLLVYVLYLLFQLKSHSYLYASMPQHVIDEESHPGVLADMLHSSSSSSTSSSSSCSDTDGSSKSHTTAKRIKRVLRGRRRRKSSASSKDTPSAPSTLRTASASTFGHAFDHSETAVVDPDNGSSESVPQPLGIIASGDEADTDGESREVRQRHADRTIKSRDFQKDKRVTVLGSASISASRRAKKGRKIEPQPVLDEEKQAEAQKLESAKPKPDDLFERPEQVFTKVGMTPEETYRRPFGKRGISNVLPAMAAMPKMLSTTVFSAANPTGLPSVGPAAATVPMKSLHRSTSLPSRLNRIDGANTGITAAQTIPYARPITSIHPTFDAEHRDDSKKHLSRTSAIILLLASTALVAVCADFLVECINYLVDNTGVNEAFIGLIVLPIVGNAAEHITAVIAAGKNKMDLAIGIAVGSSIQIALFVTPVIVLLGWILQKEMSLYFSIFETVSLFVSAFM
ncbi:MAG: hypothetical protein Q9205_006187 [Flavoplaca limonia]